MTLIFFFFYVIGVREITNSLSRTFGQRRGRSFSPAIPWPESVSSNIVSNNATACSSTATSTTTTTNGISKWAKSTCNHRYNPY